MNSASLANTNGNRIDGWKRDPLTQEDGSARVAHASFGRRVLQTPSFLHLPKRRRFQGRAGSCWAQAIVDAVETSILLHAPEKESDFSAQLAYEAARAHEHAGTDPRQIVLTDDGAYPGHGVQGCRAVGFVPESIYPYNDARVLERAPPDVLAQAYDGRGLTTWLDARGGDIAERVSAAMMDGFPVIFGMTVDSAFSGWDESKAPIASIDMRDPNRGGHMMSVADVSDKWVYLYNWWTFGGTANGLWVLTRDCFNHYARDVFLVRAPGIGTP